MKNHLLSFFALVFILFLLIASGTTETASKINSDLESEQRVHIVNDEYIDLFSNNNNRIRLQIKYFPGEHRITYECFVVFNDYLIGKLFDGWGYGVGTARNEINELVRNIIINELNNNMYLIAYKNVFIIRDGELYISGDNINKDSIIVSDDGTIYYLKGSVINKALYKNKDLIYDNISQFNIDKSGNNIVYTSFKGDNDNIYKNNQLIASTRTGYFTLPSISPDGSKVYYFEVTRNIVNDFHLRGPNIPPIIARIPFTFPYSHAYGFIFSNDSKHVMCYMEPWNMVGVYLFLDDRLLGPYGYISRDFHFTDDSLYLIFTHDGIEEKLKL
jgi:hypothetical protein